MSNPNGPKGGKYLRLHDADQIDYHLRLSRLGIKCGFCEQREKYGKVIVSP